MERYYFHLQSRRDLLGDSSGKSLPDVRSAAAYAAHLARQAEEGFARINVQRTRTWRIEVVDANGNSVLTYPLDMAPRPVSTSPQSPSLRKCSRATRPRAVQRTANGPAMPASFSGG